MKKIIVLSLFAFFFAAAVSAQYYYIYPGHTDGDEDAVMDLSILDAMEAVPESIDSADMLPEGDSADISCELALSSNVRTLNIPVNYGKKVNFFGDAPQYLNLSILLPITSRSIEYLDGTESKKSGLGDISLGADYYRKSPFAAWLAGIYFKLPTGKTDVGNGEVPLGTGTFDLGLNLWARKNIGSVSVSGGMDYVTRGSYDSDTFSETMEYGNVFSMYMQASRRIRQALYGGVKLKYVNVGESRVDGNGYDFYVPGVRGLDLIPFAKYYMAGNLTATCRIFIPVYSGWSSNKGDEPADADAERGFKVKLKLTYPLNI